MKMAALEGQESHIFQPVIEPKIDYDAERKMPSVRLGSHAGGGLMG